jgi:hypothetical protein
MELIMAKLTVKKEHLDSEVHVDLNGSSYKIVLATADQNQLNMLMGLKNAKGEAEFDYLFEKASGKEK